MASVEVNVKVNEPDISALKNLKKELKEAQALALNGDGAAAKRVAELKERLEDLKDTTKTLAGGGVEPLKNSFGLLTEGFANADFEKVKIGFKGIGQAMNAVPMLLVVEGFRLLVENFDKVIDFGRVLFDVFNDEEKAVKSLTKELEQQKEVTARVSKELNREIAEMEASGASHDKIIEKKRELIKVQIEEAVTTAKLNLAKVREVMNNDSLYESYLKTTAAALRKIGADEKAEQIEQQVALNKQERNKENVKSLNDSLELIKDLQSKAKIEEIQNDKFYAEKKKENDLAALQERLYRLGLEEQELNKANNEMIQADEEEHHVKLNEIYKQSKLNDDLTDAEFAYLKKKRREEELQDIKDGLANQALAIQTVAALSDTFFILKRNQAKKGSQEDEALAKRQFEINKAMQLGTAAINGAQSILAITSVPDFTLGIATALRIAAQVALTAKTIATIAATRFQPQGGTPNIGGGFSLPNIPNNQQAPQAQTTPKPENTTQFDNQGNRKDIVVRVSEINETQSRVAKIKEQVRF